MRKQLISFVQVMKFFVTYQTQGRLTPKHPCVRPWDKRFVKSGEMVSGRRR